MRHNQKGIAHPLLIGLLVLVIGAVGFTAYRIGRGGSTANNSSDAKTADSAEEIKTEKQSEEETVTVPTEEKPTEAAPVEKPAETTRKKTTTTTTTKKEKVYLKMNLVSASQSGSVVNVSSTLEKPATGTCNFKLYQSGYEKVHVSSHINNSRNCSGQLNVANLQTYQGWSLHAWFDGSDGKTYAYQNEQVIQLTDPN